MDFIALHDWFVIYTHLNTSCAVGTEFPNMLHEALLHDCHPLDFWVSCFFLKKKNYVFCLMKSLASPFVHIYCFYKKKC